MIGELSISLAPYSNIGAREQNEDALCTMIGEHSVLLAVADGTGGFSGGEDASHAAIAEIQKQLFCHPEISSMALENAIKAANDRIVSMRVKGREMKTTVAVLWIKGERGIASHVGDTRIYQFRNGGIRYQSIDHSMSQIAAMVGEITSDEIRSHPDRGILVRAIGAKETVKMETDELDVMAGDAFLLCSDGFWELIYEREMLACLENAKDAAKWMEEMREIISDRYGNETDNNTAIAAMVF